MADAPRKPMMSGHCSTPSTTDGKSSHERCARLGSGNRSNPAREFVPCPCPCHLGEHYECSGCGRPLRGTDQWLGDGEVTYVHIDRDGRALSEFCA